MTSGTPKVKAFCNFVVHFSDYHVFSRYHVHFLGILKFSSSSYAGNPVYPGTAKENFSNTQKV